MDVLAKAAFILAIVVAGVGYGALSGMYAWFPYPQLQEVRATVGDLALHWRNDAGLEPTRHLVLARDPGRLAYTPPEPDRQLPGLVMIAGLAPNREALQGATLYDENGEELHHWTIDYEALDPEGQDEENVLIHGIVPFEDGSLVVAFDNGNVIARIGACGQPMWVQSGRYHHVVTRTEDGSVWSWEAERLVRLDAETGAIQQTIDIREDVIAAHGLEGILAIRTHPHADELRYQVDPFHGNDVEPLPTALADAFPMFEPGDLMISLRELNLVAVLDPETGAARWWHHGPWFRQHDPDYLPDGRISVYDNGMGLGVSRVIVIDPATNEWEVTFEGNEDVPFYSWQRGVHQVLDNGDILLTEAERGRVFQVDGQGRVVWEREMIYDSTQNHIVTSATHIPPDFFDAGVFDCGT